MHELQEILEVLNMCKIPDKNASYVLMNGKDSVSFPSINLQIRTILGWVVLGRVSPKYLPGSLVGSSDPLSNVASGINRVSCFHRCELHTILLYLSNPFQFLICSPVVSVDWTGETLLKEYINLTHVTKLVGCMLRTTQPFTSSKNHELRDIFNIFETSFPLFLDCCVLFF